MCKWIKITFAQSFGPHQMA